MKRLLILVLAMIIAVSGCSIIKQDKVVNENIDLYFVLKGNEGLDIEQETIQYTSSEQKYTKTLERWIQGPDDVDKYEKSVSEKVKVLGVTLDQAGLTIDLSKDFNIFGGVMHESAVIAAVVNTMVQFPEVNSVRLLIEGKEMIAPSGNPYGYMTEMEFDPKGLGQLGTREITLYFSDDQAMNVAPEKRIINLEENATKDRLVKTLIEELIKGPVNKDYYKTIPVEARVNSVVITGDRATIDFSEELITKHWGGAAGEDMTLTSIANTVTEVEGIREVVLTVNGQPMNIEHAIIDSNNPLTRAEDRILKK